MFKKTKQKNNKKKKKTLQFIKAADVSKYFTFYYI